MSREELIERISVWNNFQVNAGMFFDQRLLAEKLIDVFQKNIEGDIVELGCYVGETAKIIQKGIDVYGVDKRLYVYDSFEGLPKPNYKRGDGFEEGSLKTSSDVLIGNFERNNLKVPTIWKGWFRDIRVKDLPDKICFAFFDGDLYESIYDSFLRVYPKVQFGGIIAVHDYSGPGTFGVKEAVKDYFGHRLTNIEVYFDRNKGSDIAFIRKEE